MDEELKTNHSDSKLSNSSDNDFESEQEKLDSELEYKILKEKQQRIIAIEFGSTIQTVSKALDNLLVLYQSDEDVDIKKATRAKAQSGIIRLKDLDARELAERYTSQFPNPNRFIIFSAIICVVLIVTILILSELGYLSSPLEEFIEEKLK